MTFVVSAGLLFLLKSILIKQLMRFASHTKNHWDNQLLLRLRTPFTIVILVVSLGLSVQMMDDSIRSHHMVGFSSKVGVIVLVTWILERIIWVGINFSGFASMLVPATRAFIVVILRTFIFVLAALAVLDSLGISITPLLASLGVGSVAIALALQDTLGNFFSGLYILLDKPVQEGNFVSLEGNVEGFIRKVGWRSTRVQLLTNNIAVIPNSKLAGSTIVNYSEPEKQVNVKVTVSVSYASDLESVERVAHQVAMEVQQKFGVSPSSFTPSVRFSSFGESGIECGIVVQATEFKDQFDMRHHLIKAIHARFNQEKIEIPFPQRDIHIRTQGVAGL